MEVLCHCADHEAMHASLCTASPVNHKPCLDKVHVNKYCKLLLSVATHFLADDNQQHFDEVPYLYTSEPGSLVNHSWFCMR